MMQEVVLSVCWILYIVRDYKKGWTSHTFTLHEGKKTSRQQLGGKKHRGKFHWLWTRNECFVHTCKHMHTLNCLWTFDFDAAAVSWCVAIEEVALRVLGLTVYPDPDPWSVASLVFLSFPPGLEPATLSPVSRPHNVAIIINYLCQVTITGHIQWTPFQVDFITLSFFTYGM